MSGYITRTKADEILEQGIQQGAEAEQKETAGYIQNMMDTFKISAEKAMDTMKIPDEKREIYTRLMMAEKGKEYAADKNDR